VVIEVVGLRRKWAS